MAILSLDLQRGVSGDMMVAALLDAGASFEKVKEVLSSLKLNGFTIDKSEVVKASIRMCDFKVKLAEDNHDADMSYLFPHLKAANHEHTGESSDVSIKGIRAVKLTQQHLNAHLSPTTESHHHHAHPHDHPHDHNHAHGHGHCHDHEHGHHHEHRSLQDVYAILENSTASAGALALAKKVFAIIAAAEAKAHGTSPELVHFHEVGGLDSIADVLAFAVCVDELQIDKVYATALGEGYGEIVCQHGLLPIPVPAVANIAAEHHLPLNLGRCYGELVTPTGAAMVAALEPEFGTPQNTVVLSTGYGAGKRAYEKPSFVRALLLQPLTTHTSSDGTALEAYAVAPFGDEIIELKSNIDDSTGELLGALMDKLLAAGAQDVSYRSIFMKKNRPAVELCVLCHEDKVPALATIIMTETSSIGVRCSRQTRLIMQRESGDFTSSLGQVRTKHCKLNPALGSYEVTYPEFESIKKLAESTRLPIKEVEARIKGELYGH